MKDADTERLKLIVAYDGTPFRGWQSQVGGNTVQDLLAAAFEEVAGRKTTVHGAGRTDAGVHATGQCAHADVPRGRIAPEKWPLALNANLPPEIRVMRCGKASRDFHARYSATGKIYTYRIWNDRILPPHELHRAWQVPVPVPLDVDAMRAATVVLVGRHDFAGFAANRGAPVADTVRTIRRVEIVRRGALVKLTFEGNGFLYKMVRLLVGTIVSVGQGRDDPEFAKRVLDGCGAVKSAYCAPADGLCLTRVLYGADDGQRGMSVRE